MARRTKILIVDDDQGMLDSLVMALEDEFELVTAVNGQDALDVIGRETVDVVLLDLMMPVLDGEGYLREHTLRHASVPVLLVSADLDLPARAADLGCHDYLQKPFALTTLEATLRRLASGTGSPGDGGGSGGARLSSGGAASSSTPKQARWRRTRGASAPGPAARI